MSLIRLRNVSKRFDSGPVLREVFFRVRSNDRVGMIGKNGTGKTTMFRLILGEVEPDDGAVEIEQDVRISYFSQFSQLEGTDSIDEILDGLFDEVHAVSDELTEIEKAITGGTEAQELDRLIKRQSDALQRMDHLDGWTYRNRIDTALTRLGFSDRHRANPVAELSGGWKNRAALAEILLERPDILLLDEPTNYLDVDGLAWLEQWIAKFAGAVVLVSHDRHFLDRTAQRIVEIENFHLQEYPGGFSDYIREKKRRFRTLQRQFKYEEELLAFESEAILDRQEAAKNPSRALKRKLANIKKRAAPRPAEKIITKIYENFHAGTHLCEVKRLSKSYDDLCLLSDLSFEVRRGDRIAIVGPNGCGKSTLLRILAGTEPPDQGSVTWRGADKPLVYFNDILESLDPGDTPTHVLNVTPLAFNARRKAADRFLELFQFSEMDRQQKIGTLSGGQRARLALAVALLSGAGTILLDEPTNHLDLTSTQVMECALAHFPGSVIVVSHDRFFIDKVATQLFVFEGNGSVRQVDGNWTIWQGKQNEDVNANP